MMTEEKDINSVINKIAQVLSMVEPAYGVHVIVDDFRSHKSLTTLYHALSEYEERYLLLEIELNESGIDAADAVFNDVSYKNFITVGGLISSTTIEVKSLQSFERIEKWNTDYDQMCYGLRINEIRDGGAFKSISNKEVFYVTEEEREQDIRRMKLKLLKFSNIRFL